MIRVTQKLVITVQTRNFEGQILIFDSVQKALDAAAEDKTIWKVSFQEFDRSSHQDRRFRLIRSDADPHVWFDHPMSTFVNRMIAAHEGTQPTQGG